MIIFGLEASKGPKIEGRDIGVEDIFGKASCHVTTRTELSVKEAKKNSQEARHRKLFMYVLYS